MPVKLSKRATEIGGEVPTSGGHSSIESEIPFIAEITIQGTADLLFHRLNCESVAEKSAVQVVGFEILDL